VKRNILSRLIIGAASWLAACGQASPLIDGHDVIVRPDQFAVLPCGINQSRPCALVVAGGKRLLFGTPAGIGQNLREDDLRQLDVAMVFSVRASDIEGLDEVRNASWQAGRKQPLLVIGPPGIDDVVSALNLAFEQADALYMVEYGSPAGGYDAALLISRSADPGQTVFDTGDLSVEYQAGSFTVTYGSGRGLQLRYCLSQPTEEAEQMDIVPSVSIGCDPVADNYTWPISAPIFIAASSS